MPPRPEFFEGKADAEVCVEVRAVVVMAPSTRKIAHSDRAVPATP